MASVFTQGWSPHDNAFPWGGDDYAPDLEADFAEPAAPARVVAAARDALGPLDVLVVNHARSGDGRLGELTAGDIDASPRARIRVNCVNPAPTDTGYLDGVDPRRRMPFGRWGEPDDAARLVAWLCSDDGRWVTGQVIDSEGGLRRWS